MLHNDIDALRKDLQQLREHVQMLTETVAQTARRVTLIEDAAQPSDDPKPEKPSRKR